MSDYRKVWGCVINLIMQLIDCNGYYNLKKFKLSIYHKCIKLLTVYNGQYIIYATSLICNVPVVSSSKIITAC